MAKFVAIHNLGRGAREMFAQGGPAMLAWLKAKYPEVVWNGMYIQWETGKTVCVWEAPDADSIIEGFEELQIPYEDVFPVEWVSARDALTGP